MQPSRFEPVPSPCRQICQLNARDVCIGCARTREEIGEWSQATRERQMEILRNTIKRSERPDASSKG